MGEKQEFQPLTGEDRITVVLYRIGITVSTVIVVWLAYLLARSSSGAGMVALFRAADLLGYALFASTGLCVFFIHLYIGKFKTYLKNLYFLGLGCLVALLVVGKGSPAAALVTEPVTALLLLPLAGCIGFVTAKEAFCFKLFEGYLLAMIMPAYLVLAAVGALASGGLSYGLGLIALLLAVFAFRKVPMPLAWDIGDKTAYQ